MRRVARGYANIREAVGDDIDIAVHCHNEFDTPSAILVAKAVEPMNPLFYEDALNPAFSEGWVALKRATRPCPSALGSSTWETTPLSVEASITQTNWSIS